jgi:hypothetical protein
MIDEIGEVSAVQYFYAFETFGPNRGDEHRFRSLDSLVKRLGGSNYRIEHDTAFRPPVRTVMILRSAGKAGGWNIHRRVRIPTEFFEQEEENR